MYEEITYEHILQRMLDKVPMDVDKREGAIIYNALAPAAVELQNMYIELDVILNEAFADTQSRPYLIKRAAERGIIPSEATKAVVKGVFNIDIPINSRFSLGDYNYKVVEQITSGQFKLECETSGELGNQIGTLLPISYIAGLTHAQVTEILIPGEEAEATENLRQRYFSSLESQSYGGNVADYKEKTMALAGIGGVKVYPVWDGGGSVKLVIMDSTYAVPSSALIEATQSAVDPIVNQGQGKGFAPIGHVVTVMGVTGTAVDIAATITYQEGWSWEDVQPYVTAAIDEYFHALASDWDTSDNLIVRISQIETRLLNLTGIVDIANTTINTLAQNLVIDQDSIPVRGDVSG